MRAWWSQKFETRAIRTLAVSAAFLITLSESSPLVRTDLLATEVIPSCEAALSIADSLAQRPVRPDAPVLIRALEVLRQQVNSLRPSLFQNAPSLAITPSPKTVKVYIESKSITELRKELHLSPSEVNDYLRFQKALVIETLRELRVPMGSLFVDYKSLRFEVSPKDYPPEVVAHWLSHFDQRLRAYLKSLLQNRGSEVRARVDELPLMTIGSSTEHHADASIAARFSPVPVSVVSFSDAEGSLHQHLLKAEEFRRAFAQKAKSFPAEIGAGLIDTRIAGEQRTEVPSLWVQVLARRYEDNDVLRKKISRILPGTYEVDHETIELLRKYFASTNLFRPPNEYSAKEIRLFEEVLEPSEASESVLVPSADFVISADLESVGAHHSLEIQHQLAAAFSAHSDLSTFSTVDMKNLFRTLTYGPSVLRMKQKLSQTKEAYEQWKATGAEDLVLHVTGDEWAVSGRQKDVRVSAAGDLLTKIPSEMRVSFVQIRNTPLEEKVRRATPETLEGLEDEISHYRHLSETLSKVLAERLLDASPPDLRAYAWPMEVVPLNSIGLLKVRVWSPAFEGKPKPTLEALKEDLRAQDIPETLVARFHELEWMKP